MKPGTPLLAGVMGWPIAHSLSPRLHGHWLRRYGVNGHYVPLAVRPSDLAEALAVLPRIGFRGVNVTIPHKEQALALANEVTARAELVGAANTLTFGDGGAIHADNTDGYGFIANLRQTAPGWSANAGPALVLGAGGAARGVVAALLGEGAPEVRIANRTRERSVALRDHFGDRITVVDWFGADEAASGAATIVNTTALGMHDSSATPLSLDWASSAALVTDIVYAPLVTPLLARAAERGLATVDGLGMLLHQAAPGFEAWFGVRPEVDDDLRAAVLRA